MRSHDEIKELLIAFVLGQLSQEEVSEITPHLVECQDCSGEVKKLARLLECARQTEDLTADEQLCKSAREAILSAAAEVEKPAPSRTIIWRAVVKSRITRPAAAAVIVIAVMIGMQQVGGSSVAWGDVLRKVEQIQTLSCRLWTSIKGPGGKAQEAEIFVHDSSKYGSRMDTYVDNKLVSTIYGPGGENVIIMVIPEAKGYTRMSFTEEQRKQMQEKEKNPREFLKLFLSVDHKGLGRKTIDGIEVEGIEVDSPKVGGGMFEEAIGRLWVDVETELPVLMEVEGVAAGGEVQSKMVMDEFRWDEKLEAGFFEPNIPPDYTLLSEVTMPADDEGEAIEGLRFFAEVADGRYPTSLAKLTAEHELQQAWKKKYDRPPTNQELEKFLSVNTACQFYARLVEENTDVVYHGGKVTAEDIDSELIRWRISDTEFRVIYGDLRVENVVDKEKLLDKAIELSGAKLPPDKRGKLMRILSLNEKDVIRGLGVWLELLDGRYPKSLEPKMAIKQSEPLLRAKYGGIKQANKEKEKEAKGKTFDIFFASAFYDKLVREKKDVRYYGDKVAVGDSDKVLMRWKLSRDKYRVIFGDLRRDSVTADKLAELEKGSAK
ncbi:MAG: anti-sigma factor family protein [Planctomycetota bacterium]